MRKTRRCGRRTRAVLAAAGALCLQAQFAHAVEVSWSNTAGGTYSTGTNWQLGSPPAPDDIAVFNTSATYTVSFIANASAQGLYVRKDQVAFDLGTRTLALTQNVGNVDHMVVGRLSGDAGQLNVASGILTSTTNVGTVMVGAAGGATGRIDFGGTAQWSIACSARVGDSGAGTVNHTGGSITFNQSDPGTALSIGFASGSGGTYNLSGGSLNASVATDFVEAIGVSGTGLFNQTGGFNTTDSLHLGVGATGVGRYVLSGGSISSGQTLVGIAGTGTFEQTAGSHNISGALVLGSESDSGTGRYTMSVSLGVLNAGSLRVCRGSQFAIDLGLVNVTGEATLGGGPVAGQAVMTLTDDTINQSELNAPTLTVGTDSAFTQIRGTLDVNHLRLTGGVASFTGGSQSIGSVSISAASTYHIGGTGARIIGGQTIQNDGTLNYSSAVLQLQSGASIANAGSFRISSQDGIAAGVGGGSIVNTGVIAKMAGNLTTSFGAGVTLINNGGSIEVQSGALSVDGILNVGAGTMAKNGVGHFIVNTASQTWDPAATFRVNDGTASFPLGLNPSGVNAGPALKVNVATARLGGVSWLADVSINTPGTAVIEAGGHAVLVTRALDIDVDDGGALDVNDNTVIVDYSVLSVLDTVVAYLISGFASGAWTGVGLRSTVAGTTSTHGLGYGEASALGLSEYAGVSLDTTAVVITYAPNGDTDLDGDVDVADLGVLASHWQTAGSWIHGDCDYNGWIDINDLGRLATNWQTGTNNAPLPGALASFGLPTTVPESGALLLGAPLVAGMCKRRRAVSLQDLAPSHGR
jgi:hypothetical protein